MRHLMPRKAALIFTAILFSVVIIYFAAVEKGNEGVKGKVSDFTSTIFSEITVRDSDKDGLKDWEEKLWKTDPYNADTDGDGTSDNDEVKLGRDPTLPGPDDLRKDDENFFDNTKSIQQEDSSSISEELFSNYIGLKRRGLLNTENEQELIERLIQSNTDIYEFNQYTISSFTTVSDSSESISEYKKHLEKNFADFSKITENELVVMTTALENGSELEFEKLEYAATVYENVVKNLILIEVPNTARFIHTDLLNGLTYFAEIIRGMKEVTTNPLAAVTAVNSYTEAETYIQNVFFELNAYFIDNGLIE